MKRIISTLMATITLLVGVFCLPAQNASALGSTTVYMFHREYLGTAWVGNTTYSIWDVSFAHDGRNAFEVWTTRGYTVNNEFGNSKLISNMSYYSNMNLSNSSLNNSNKFDYSYAPK